MTHDPGIPTWNLARIPPCVCRLLAKTKGKNGQERLATDLELMERTGWGMTHLWTVYKSASWTDVTVGDMDLFLWACGLHPSKQRRYRWVIRRASEHGMEGIRNLRHLRASNVPWRNFQVNAILRMVERYLANEQRSERNRVEA